MSEHGHCPNCGADLDGGLIWATGMKMYGDFEKADEYAKAYGATRTTGKWGRRISIYNLDLDRTVAWKCPDCEHQWERKWEKSA